MLHEEYWIERLKEDLEEMKKRHKDEQKAIRDQIKKLERGL